MSDTSTSTVAKAEKAKTKREIHNERVIADAKRAFETHKIVSFEKTPGLDHIGRWLLKRADGKQWCWVEIAELRGGHMLVHGDIKHTFFNLYQSPGDIAGSLVRWMGGREAPCSYFREKLETRSGDYRPGLKWDAEIADEDARAWNAERLADLRAETECDEEDEDDEEGGSEDGGEDGAPDEAFEQTSLDSAAADEEDEITEIINDGVSEDLDAAEHRRRWYEAGIDPEDFDGWGMVLCFDTVMAWAALARLTTLLREEAAAAEKVKGEEGASHE